MTWSVAVAVALGCDKALGIKVRTVGHSTISAWLNALLYRQQNPSPHPLGPGHPMEPVPKLPYFLSASSEFL